MINSKSNKDWIHLTLNLVSWEQSIIRRIFLSFDSNDTERNHVHRSINNEREMCVISRYRKLLISPLLRSLSVCILKLDRTQSGFYSHKSGSGASALLHSAVLSGDSFSLHHQRPKEWLIFHKRPASKKLHIGKSESTGIPLGKIQRKWNLRSFT